MESSRDSILKAALALSADDRAVVIDRLLASLTQESDGGLDAAWAEEIERRIAAYDRGETAALPLEDVKRLLHKRRSA
jgi:putative addiction module component (TIGR02574 family)